MVLRNSPLKIRDAKGSAVCQAGWIRKNVHGGSRGAAHGTPGLQPASPEELTVEVLAQRLHPGKRFSVATVSRYVAR